MREIVHNVICDRCGTVGVMDKVPGRTCMEIPEGWGLTRMLPLKLTETGQAELCPTCSTGYNSIISKHDTSIVNYLTELMAHSADV